jgi:hypothetical protein
MQGKQMRVSINIKKKVPYFHFKREEQENSRRDLTKQA